MVLNDWLLWAVWIMLVFAFLLGATFWMSGTRGRSSRTDDQPNAQLPPVRRAAVPHWLSPYGSFRHTFGGTHEGQAPRDYRPSDERLAGEINDALTLSEELDPTEVKVQVKSGVATLTGSVADRHEKRIAEAIVVSVPGVSCVLNNLSTRKHAA